MKHARCKGCGDLFSYEGRKEPKVCAKCVASPMEHGYGRTTSVSDSFFGTRRVRGSYGFASSTRFEQEAS